MNALAKRLRRLEDARAPLDREEEKWRAIVEAIEESRRRHEGANYKPRKPFPPGSFDGCHTIADHILRARKLYMEREEAQREAQPPKSEPE